MSPAEAGALLDEPDWAERFAETDRSDIAFENLLLTWRKFHAVALADGKHKLAPSVDGVIALALVGVMPPRHTEDRTAGHYEEQHDDHCFFVSEGRAWRVVGTEDRMLMLKSPFSSEERQMPLDPLMRWAKYCEAHNAELEARRERNEPLDMP